MSIIFIVLAMSGLLYIAYRTYGTFLAKKVFDLDDTFKTLLLRWKTVWIMYPRNRNS